MHFVMMCDENPNIISVESGAHGRGLIETITFVLEFRGVNIVTLTQKVIKICGSKYCTGYNITPYGQTETHVFGT